MDNLGQYIPSRSSPDLEAVAEWNSLYSQLLPAQEARSVLSEAWRSQVWETPVRKGKGGHPWADSGGVPLMSVLLPGRGGLQAERRSLRGGW